MFSHFFSKSYFDFLNPLFNWWSAAVVVFGFSVFLFVWFFSKKIIFYFLKKYITRSEEPGKWQKNLAKGVKQLILSVTAFLVFRWFFDPAPLPVFQIWISFSCIWILYALTSPLSLLIKNACLKEHSGEYQHLMSFLENTLRIAVVAAGGVFIVQNMGFNVSSVLAGLGLGGVAAALAAKETLSNIFGSIVIAFDRPFSSGDWIHFDDTEGTVEHIGIRSTQIKTFYDSVISVPNSIIAQSKIDNLGKRKVRRTRFTLGITYSTPSDKIEKFVAGIKSIIQSHPKTKKNYYQVSFSGYADSSLNIFVNFFLHAADWNEELVSRQEVFLAILNLAQKESIEFAYPSQSLYIEKMNPGK